MSIDHLDCIFKPRRVAVIGATEVPGKVGYTVLRNLIGHGFQGAVYPVNPKRESVQGIEAYRDVEHLPHPADLAIICTPAAGVPDLIRQCGRAGILGATVLSAGFREVGQAGLELEQQMLQAAAETPGMRILGPNCLGFIVPSRSLNASFAGSMPASGGIALVSQSGALCTAVLDWAIERGVGFSTFVSIGNMADVSVADIIDYLAADPQTQSMILYIESLRDARHFMSAARAFARKKPLVAYKSGRFADSARAAASHTGALAGVDAVYDAAFQRSGIVRVSAIDDVFDDAQLLTRGRYPAGSALAIVTNAGGPGIMATDGLLARQGQLAKLSSQSIAALDAELPECWSHANPVDVLGDADPRRFAAALQIVLADPAVAAALVILTPQAMTDPTVTAAAVAEVAEQTTKPVLAAWMGGASVAAGMELLAAKGISAYNTPEHAVAAFMHLINYGRNLALLYETPRMVPLEFNGQRHEARAILERARSAGQTILSGLESKAVVEAYGIPITPSQVARSADEAVNSAHKLGFPVVLKILSPQITHKTDVQGVILNLADKAAVRAAFASILESAHRCRPDAELLGVTVEPMTAAAGGVELIVGAKRDPVFGPVILVGIGGIAAELFNDRALGLPPLNDRLARHLLESLHCWPLLAGFRGRQAVDIDRLVEILIRFSHLLAECDDIQEIDVNPLLVWATMALALDARIVLTPQPRKPSRRPFSHLAIRPYPEEFVRRASLKDGTSIVLRPIMPEDEPAWLEFHAQCSDETVHARFRCLFKATHEAASRLCFLDYDREMAMVAQLDGPQPSPFLGVAHLMADPDHVEAEFAVQVADRWQGRGVGSALCDACLDVARCWGIAAVTAETEPANDRMLAIFRRRTFLMQRVQDTILARKELVPGVATEDNLACSTHR